MHIMKFNNIKISENILLNLLNAGYGDTGLYTLLGSVYQLTKRPELAKLIFQRGIDRYPNEPELYYSMGELLYEKRPEEAESFFKKAHAANNGYLPARIRLIEYNISKNKCRQAKEYAFGSKDSFSVSYQLAVWKPLHMS